MAIKLAGPVESLRTERGDYAVTVKGIEIFYCDNEPEADYMVNFLSSFSIFHQLTSAAFGVIRRLREIRDDRAALTSHVVDAKSELATGADETPGEASAAAWREQNYPTEKPAPEREGDE